MKHLATLICFFSLAGCRPAELITAPTGPPVVTLPAGYQWVSPDEAEKLIATETGLQILDVRSEDEIRSGAGWINQAQKASYLHDNKDYLRAADKSKPWLVYCALGPRSEFTAADMAPLGFKRVYLLRGGFNAWIAAHKSVVK